MAGIITRSKKRKAEDDSLRGEEAPTNKPKAESLVCDHPGRKPGHIFCWQCGERFPVDFAIQDDWIIPAGERKDVRRAVDMTVDTIKPMRRAQGGRWYIRVGVSIGNIKTFADAQIDTGSGQSYMHRGWGAKTFQLPLVDEGVVTAMVHIACDSSRQVVFKTIDPDGGAADSFMVDDDTPLLFGMDVLCDCLVVTDGQHGSVAFQGQSQQANDLPVVKSTTRRKTTGGVLVWNANCAPPLVWLGIGIGDKLQFTDCLVDTGAPGRTCVSMQWARENLGLVIDDKDSGLCMNGYIKFASQAALRVEFEIVDENDPNEGHVVCDPPVLLAADVLDQCTFVSGPRGGALMLNAR
jgi:hypothetical protein